MRDSSPNLISEIDSYLSRTVQADSEKIVVATRTVVVNPNSLIEKGIHFKLKRATLSRLVHLAIGSWYLGDLGFVLREDLREKSKQLCLDDRILLGILLSSKAQMLNFLLDTSLWHSRDFFGNQLPQLVKELWELKWNTNFFWKVSVPQRKRGYNDKGSRALDPFWKSARPFWKDNIDQQEKEIKEETAQDTLDFILGFLL